MRGLGTTLRQRALTLIGVAVALSGLGAVLGLSASRAGTRVAAMTTTQAAGTGTDPGSTGTGTGTTGGMGATGTTGTTVTTGSTGTTGTTVTTGGMGSTGTTSTTGTTTGSSSTHPASVVACTFCTPVIAIGAVAHPDLGFFYGGRRLPTGGMLVVAVIITAAERARITSFKVRFPERLSVALPVRQRRLIRAGAARITFHADAITLTLAKVSTSATLTVPAAALAPRLAGRRRLKVGVFFTVRQGRHLQRVGSALEIG